MSLFASPRLVGVVDSLLPSWVTGDCDRLTLNRARLIVGTVLGAIVFALVSGTFHAFTDTRQRALFNFACAPLGLLVIAFPHWMGRLAQSRARRGLPAGPLAVRAMLDVFLGILLIAMLIGPLLSANPFNVPVAIATLPFLAATLGGLRSGFFWTAITLTALSGMTAAVWGDPVRELVGWNAVVVACVVGIGGCVAEAAREQARRDADASSLEASDLARSRDEAHAELRASRELLAHAFRRMPAMLILSDLATGRIIDVNECFERLSGWKLDEARGRTLSDLDAWVSPDDRERLIAVMLDGGQSKDIEILLRTRSGGEVWLLAAADVLEMNGRAHVLAQGIDITDRKRAEQALATSRKQLEERVVEGDEQLRASRRELRHQRQLASIGTLAAGIAHQINNPIASIMASAEFALIAAQDDESKGTAIREEALRAAISEATRCGQIVKNVLRFARQQPTARWVESIGPVVLRAVTICRDYVGEHGGELRVEIEDARLPVLMSPIEIEQVLVNLIRNAAEALDGGGSIGVRVDRRQDRVEIAIDDDGRGMPKALLDRVFEPFYTTRVQEGGTGLGLAVAHGVIVDHGGEIHVESEVGKGTWVRILLPLAPS
ncbi:MAG: PAS domain S-box protein [Deltaproteobacteria bacterium]|nr:PAS domain S-box protein [Deltaproteobacteria bacterium]